MRRSRARTAPRAGPCPATRIPCRQRPRRSRLARSAVSRRSGKVAHRGLCLEYCPMEWVSSSIQCSCTALPCSQSIRSPAKRSKSRSNVPSVAPCSIAIAARCASLTRLPPRPAPISRRPSMGACLSVGPMTRARGCESHSSTTPKAVSSGRAERTMRGCVLNRKNPASACQVNAMPARSENASSIQRAATERCGASRLTAYTSTFTSGVFIPFPFLINPEAQPDQIPLPPGEAERRERARSATRRAVRYARGVSAIRSEAWTHAYPNPHPALRAKTTAARCALLSEEKETAYCRSLESFGRWHPAVGDVVQFVSQGQRLGQVHKGLAHVKRTLLERWHVLRGLGQACTHGVVDGLLEGESALAHCPLQQGFHVGLEGDGGAHVITSIIDQTS